MTSSATAAAVASLFLFDFDGVVCDSCDECTVSALRTCAELRVLPADAPTQPPAWLLASMRQIRPAIEVGWQIPVLLSVHVEQRAAADAGGPPAQSAAEIVRDYEALVAERLARWGKTDADMVAAFGSVRDAWIADDLSSWLEINRMYDGVASAIIGCVGEKVLVTTKQQRFAIALMRHAGVPADALPDDDILGLGQYRGKADVIAERMGRGGHAPADVHFFEDRWPTLAKCLTDERLDGVRLYLCSWGYCTEAELQKARDEPRVEVLDLAGFASLVGSRGK